MVFGILLTFDSEAHEDHTNVVQKVRNSRINLVGIIVCCHSHNMRYSEALSVQNARTVQSSAWPLQQSLQLRSDSDKQSYFLSGHTYTLQVNRPDLCDLSGNHTFQFSRSHALMGHALFQTQQIHTPDTINVSKFSCLLFPDFLE